MAGLTSSASNKACVQGVQLFSSVRYLSIWTGSDLDFSKNQISYIGPQVWEKKTLWIWAANKKVSGLKWRVEQQKFWTVSHSQLTQLKKWEPIYAFRYFKDLRTRFLLKTIVVWLSKYILLDGMPKFSKAEDIQTWIWIPQFSRQRIFLKGRKPEIWSSLRVFCIFL